MNSKILRDLCESYQNIYDGGFESWVDSLIEEGYDLSDYTWDEMYEAYIEERRGAAAGLANRNVITPAAKPQIAGGGMGGMRGTGRNRTSTQTSSSPPGALRVAPTAKPPAPTPAAKPPAATAKTAPTPTTKPTAKVAPTPTPAAPKRTFNPLMQKTFGYQTGYAPDQIKNDPKKMAQMGSTRNISSSFEWGSSSKIVDDVANAYASIYEAKKKDQDQDGDNDFADVQIARMIASGMSKAQAIAAVKGKPYNEEYELDEGLGSAIKGLFGRKKKEEEEASKPESRGTELRRKYNVGPEKSDTSAKRQILNRSRARKERDEERYGNSVYTKKVAQQSADAHDRYLKAGYSKYGADLKHGRGNKARKRAEALQREEFEFWVNSLIEEGYDLSDYTWDEMYEIYEETAEERDARIAARRARVREMESQGRVMTSSRRTSERAKQRRQEKKDEALERAANRALADTIGVTRRSDKPMGSEAPASKEAAPSANRRLGRTVKRDTLASRADQLLKMLQNEDFELYEKIATPPSRFNLRKGLTPEQRRLRRSGDFYAYGNDSDPGERRISTSKGEGGITKNPKKLRKQKAIGEFPEDFELWIDELLDEGYELEDWTNEELYDLYEEILKEKYSR